MTTSAFDVLMTLSSGPAFVGVILWRLFPDGIAGVLREWSASRTAVWARKLPDTRPDDQTALAVLRLLLPSGGAPADQTGPDPQERPPTPAEPPP
ncbi:hypothetical protein ACIQI8_42050 [Streptomyces sp. NPDC092369]|uniref:hypothetical protein n=1 Tax=Streptomyces sp. NPDC092369 TaxID=3366015 RepID=UPI0038136CA2